MRQAECVRCEDVLVDVAAAAAKLVFETLDYGQQLIAVLLRKLLRVHCSSSSIGTGIAISSGSSPVHSDTYLIDHLRVGQATALTRSDGPAFGSSRMIATACCTIENRP